MILDTTAGNRFMWPCKNPPHTIFIDREMRLKVKPDIFADFEYLPFRDDVFELAFFDPPHIYGKLPFFFNLPHKTHGGWYGVFKNKKRMVKGVHNAQKEIHRVAERVCFKWHPGKISFWKILGLFRDLWDVVFEYTCHPRNVRGVHHRATGSKWFTMVRKNNS